MISKPLSSPRRARVTVLVTVFGLAMTAFGVTAEAQETEMTVAVPAEPSTLLPRNACSRPANFITDNIYERLTRRDDNGEVVGWLAESYEQVDDTTWRFNLREGINFSNGEPLNAEAVVTTLDYYLDPDAASGCVGDYATVTGAEMVDEYTVDIKTDTLDPTIPSRLLKLYIVAPGWLTDTPDEEAATTAVGTGPYLLDTWNRGSEIVLRANEDYWGDPKPSIDIVNVVPRAETAVRAAMVQAGEADVAIQISSEQADNVPVAIQAPTTEAVFIRLDTENPVLSDIRVREAVALSIDTATIREALYPNVSSPLHGHITRASALGVNTDLGDYPFDPERATELVEEAGAQGKTLELIVRTDEIPNVMELAEAVQAMIEVTGLDVTLVPMEAAPWRELLFTNTDGAERSDMMFVAASNIQFDSSRVMNFYFGNGQFSQAHDDAFQAKLEEAGATAGDGRGPMYEELWKEVHANYWVVPLFGIDYLHGLSERVEWTPRDDTFVYLNTFSLKE